MINWFEKHNKTSWAITILIAGIIFYLSSITFAPSTSTYAWKAFAYHFYAFLFLSAFLHISLSKGKTKKYFFPAILILILYAISDEVHQLFVPGRACTILDILVDLTGILFASLIYI